MFKRITIIFLLLAVIAVTFSKGFVILDFYSNQSEIALKYCVNKDKPMMHCNGHCFLMKALKKEQQQEQNLGDAFNKLVVMICQHHFPEITEDSTKITKDIHKQILPANTQIWQLFIVDRLLKPPAVIA